eukprot:CAMPEP_0174716618 /NCGR_PEP_ID=MMETSP1094-20130205/24354_1 /TAXON_ID=156173 /ORGANISM="Chrysochromulina brevifilum, Strain UTEX LB 985" /LENGTH=323 /DNA_ID=CAMNT_0015916399 /DNA_START=83 /DNA_END=1054 /DNA_ORIENTATION=+
MSKRPGSDIADGDSKKARTQGEGDEEDQHLVYSPCVVPPELPSKMNSLVEVLLPAKHLTSDSKQVRLRQLWGTDIYTDDSDLVAVLVHTGHVKLKATAPKTPLLVSLRVCPMQASYATSERNGLRSREWSGKHGGVSYKVERCLQHTAGTVPQPELSMLQPNPLTRQIPGSLVQIAPGPGKSFAVPPAACLVVFSLSNEPWLKYSLALVADQGTDRERWTSTRMRREAMYLESSSRRFELTLQQPAATDGEFDKYTLSQVLEPHEMDRRALEAAGVPLPRSAVQLLHEDLDWEELVWGPGFVRVRGDEFPLLRMLYIPHSVAA